MTEFKRYTITAALPYANGPLHIGHVAGAYLPADIYVRYLRQKERDVAFICGSDEHGAAITIRAKKEGKTAREIVDTYHPMIRDAMAGMDIVFDIYHRTSSPLHHRTSSDFFKRLHELGVLEEKESEQYYDADFDQFLADRYIKGTCPKCSNPEAYGDQCENCGTTLSPQELIDPVSTLSGKLPVMRKTRHWYLPLQHHQAWLKTWIEEGTIDGEMHHPPKSWKRNVVGQCLSWLNDGLQPRAVTRDLDWGVPVPLPDAEGKVLYVWLDAPIGYISATRQWAQDQGKDWAPYWQDKDTKLLHFIGKDNIVFHCIIFPAILRAHGDFILPQNVPANEFMNLQGGKISTSKNRAVWVHEFLQEWPGKSDVLRYVLCMNMPETKDSEFTWEDFQARNNNELVAILGNYVNRVMVLMHKYFDGVVPVDVAEPPFDPDQGMAKSKVDVFVGVEQSIEQFRFREALSSAMELARSGNKYLTDQEPWKKIKTDKDAVAKVLAVNVQIIANLSIVLRPFLPATAKKIAEMLHAPSEWTWKDNGRADLVPKGHQLGKPELLFDKIEHTDIQPHIDKLLAMDKVQAVPADSGTDSQTSTAEGKPEISFDDFTKMDIRVGTILDAERVPKADKLLKLSVDLGSEKRTIVSGIAEHYEPQDVIGAQVTVLVNLAPRKIRGVESQGMILMAEDASGLRFVAPAKPTDNGSVVN